MHHANENYYLTRVWDLDVYLPRLFNFKSPVSTINFGWRVMEEVIG